MGVTAQEEGIVKGVHQCIHRIANKNDYLPVNSLLSIQKLQLVSQNGWNYNITKMLSMEIMYGSGQDFT